LKTKRNRRIWLNKEKDPLADNEERGEDKINHTTTPSDTITEGRRRKGKQFRAVDKREKERERERDEGQHKGNEHKY
jgi:hypothetical protein